jgi:hypothetical protein
MASVVPSIDVVRCLRSRRAFSFIVQSKVPINADGGLALLIPTINRAWSMAPDNLNYLMSDQIIPYLPAEMDPEKEQEARNLLATSDTLYDSEKAAQIAYTLVTSRKLSLTIDQSFQENSTALEISTSLKRNLAELAQLEILLKRQTQDDFDNNQVLIHSHLDPKTLRPASGLSRISASFGGDMDIALGGGLDEGTYAILLGSKGEGKTWIASAVAAQNAARMGRNVLFITLENSKYSISDRTTPLYLEMPFFASSFRAFRDALFKQKTDHVTYEMLEALIAMSVPIGNPIIGAWNDDFLKRIKDLHYPMTKLDAVNELGDHFYEALNILIDFRKQQRSGVIDIRYYPANSLRSSDIEMILETSNIKYHLIIIDYLNAVQVPPTAQKHEHLGWFSDEVRRYAGQYKCASLINAQLKRGFKIFSKATNKGGLDEDVFFEFIAESFKAVWGADYVMVLVAGNFVDHTQKGTYAVYDRSILLNRARESKAGDWFGFKMDFNSGQTQIKKISV